MAIQKTHTLSIWVMAAILGLTPLIYPGLFYTSTDFLPKRLFLYFSSAILCFIWLWHRGFIPTQSIQSSLTKISALYVIWSILSIFWSTNTFTGWIEALQLIVVFTLFLFTTTLNFRHHIQTISFVATLGGFLVSLIGIAQYLGLGFETLLSVGLPSSTFIFRNLAAAYLLCVIPLGILALVLVNNTLQKNICILSLLSMFLYLFYTRTRGAWVALFCAAILICIVVVQFQSLRETLKNLLSNIWHTPSNRWVLIASIALFIGGGLLPAQTSQTVIQQFDEQKSTATTAVTSLLTPGSDRGRLTMWRHTGRMIADHLLIGVGLDNWEYFYPLYDPGEKITFHSEPVRPHNDLLWITAELGMIGLCLYLALLFLAIQSIFKILKQKDKQAASIATMALMGLTSLLIYSFFSFPKEQPTPTLFFWFYLGLINKSAPIQKQKNHTMIPLLGGVVCLIAFYMGMRHIQFDQHYQTARAYEMRQQWPQAYQAINQALAAGNFDHRAKFLKGQYLQKMSKYDLATTAYLDALQSHPNYAHTHHNLGGAYAARGNLNQAITHFKRAVAIRPSYHQALLHLGNAYVATQQFDLAQKVFTEILKNTPQSADAYTNLGAVYVRQNEFEPAIQAFLKALEINPKNAQAYNNLAYAYEQTMQISKAITTYETLLKHWQGDPQYLTTIKNRITYLRQHIKTPQ